MNWASTIARVNKNFRKAKLLPMRKRKILKYIIEGCVIGEIILSGVSSVKFINRKAAANQVNQTKVTNFSSFSFTPQAKEFIIKNGFVVIPSKKYKEIYEIYRDCHNTNIPIFVTCDAVLHSAHILFDYTLRILEIEKLMPELEKLTGSMLSASIKQYNEAKDSKVKAAAKKNVAFFSVASKLLGQNKEIPAYAKNSVEKELELIKQHSGLQYSPIFGYKEDYTQYIPRGHYTRNEKFKRFFLAMMWYGRIKFRLKPGKSERMIQKGKEETREALLIVSALNKTKVKQERTLTIWENIYIPTTFFCGETDDLNIYDYQKLMREVYGSDISIADLVDEEKLELFISKAQKLKKPRILSDFSHPSEDWRKESHAFRFMGQRFIPDSYIFQELVYDKVGTEKMPRAFPKGLDVMAIVGSKRAQKILQKEGDLNYLNYNQQLDKLKEQFSSYEEKDWRQNLYWNWLYTLKLLLLKKNENGPFFMQNSAWIDKKLNTCLGSWAELRHDTILYGKQSYTKLTAISPQNLKLTKGYVEPYPEVYHQIAFLVRQMREKLEERGLLIAEGKQKLLDFENLLLTLKDISKKELNNEDLTEKEYRIIWNIGNLLHRLYDFSPKIKEKITSGVDERMAVIADVHTDPNSMKVLEVGVGNPFLIYVITKTGNETKISKGGVFSYYEFKIPMQERLDDDTWQKRLQRQEVPSLPEWTGSFIIE